MAHSFSEILIHAVFSTKDREPMLTPEIKSTLLPYISGIAANLKCRLHLINGPDDHVHILASLSSSTCIADFIRVVKANSSKYVREDLKAKTFGWQTGYGAFSVSHSNKDDVFKYIANQEEHHHKMTFKDEFVALLTKHGIEYDERYIWE